MSWLKRQLDRYSVKKAKELIREEWRSSKSPSFFLAMGVGVGSAFAPIGLQTPLLILAMFILRTPRILSFAFFEITKLIPLPVYLYVDYKVGGILIEGPPLNLEFFKNPDWGAIKVYVARFFAGGLLLYSLIIMAFSIVYLLLKRFKRAQSERGSV